MQKMYAKLLLTEAMSCEKDGCKLVANQLYLMGIQELETLFDACGTLPSIYHSRFDEIKDHNEKLDKLIEEHTQNGRSLEQVYIKENSTGNSYRRLFEKYLDSRIQEVLIYETFLLKKHQFRNLSNFLELLRRNCPKLKYVHVVTKRESSCTSETSLNTEKIFEDIYFQLQNHRISFSYSFEPDLHDRRILLGNGINIKLHRGLDIYKPKDDSTLRSNDFDLRKCYKNNIDIFHWESFV